MISPVIQYTVATALTVSAAAGLIVAFTYCRHRAQLRDAIAYAQQRAAHLERHVNEALAVANPVDHFALWTQEMETTP